MKVFLVEMDMLLGPYHFLCFMVPHAYVTDSWSSVTKYACGRLFCAPVGFNSVEKRKKAAEREAEQGSRTEEEEK